MFPKCSTFDRYSYNGSRTFLYGVEKFSVGTFPSGNLFSMNFIEKAFRRERKLEWKSRKLSGNPSFYLPTWKVRSSLQFFHLRMYEKIAEMLPFQSIVTSMLHRLTRMDWENSPWGYCLQEVGQDEIFQGRNSGKKEEWTGRVGKWSRNSCFHLPTQKIL